jgi:putative transposase
VLITRQTAQLRRGHFTWRLAPQLRWLSNRAENSHQPTRRERIMKRFKSPRQVQRFLPIHEQIANVFSRRPTQDTAANFRTARNQALHHLG